MPTIGPPPLAGAPCVGISIWRYRGAEVGVSCFVKMRGLDMAL